MEASEDKEMLQADQDQSVTTMAEHEEDESFLAPGEDGISSFASFDMSLLPEEILERIISFASPYKDMDTVKLVSKQWNRVLTSVIKQIRRIFHQQLMVCNVNWTQVVQEAADSDPQSRYPCMRSLSVSDRFSHSAAYVDGSMFVFGGCSSTSTTFNDLWRLDLTTRQWIRPVAMGSYPSPKACATMVVYQGKLVMFGGWSHPIPYPLHQSAHYFSELHRYDPLTNRWSLLLTVGPEPDPVGGHSASVAGDLMVVFGGSSRPGHGSNKVWVYNFVKNCWSTPRIAPGIQPEPRYGQFQCTLDDRHILIMGGCVGHNKVFNDFYILNLDPCDPWSWTKLDVFHPQLAAQQTWCHAACKVNDSIVVVAKSSKPREAENKPPHLMRVSPVARSSSNNPGGSSTATKPSLQPQQRHQQAQPQPQCVQPSAEGGFSPKAGVRQLPDGPEEEVAAQPSLSNNRNLLALQQRLHRDCMSLSDKDSHHHNSQAEHDVAESHIERLQNRAQLQGDDGNPNPRNNHGQQQQPQPQVPYHDQHQHHQNQQAFHQDFNQPHAGQLHHRANASSPWHAMAMPSVRPNATSNRQRQLEALQRQEELLLSKSRALAAARFKDPATSRNAFGAGAGPSVCSSVEEEEDIPATVLTKNRMDVHVVDISRALTELSVVWKPESPLQPPGAPTETICSSLVEGRGELILFGGVSREVSSPMVTNVAVNKLYFLHP